MKAVLTVLAIVFASVLARPEVRLEEGKDAFPRQYPFMAMVYKNSDFICSGALIGKQWILTDAHCPSSVTGHLVVDIGGVKLNATIETGRHSYPAGKYFAHPNYMNLFNKNIGLIRLDMKVEYSPNILPIDMPKKGDILEADAEVTILGFTDNKLQSGLATTMSNADCHVYVTPEMVCMSPESPSVPSGSSDQGAPMIKYREDGQPVLVGLSALFGGRLAPSVYVRTENHLQWISDETGILF